MVANPYAIRPLRAYRALQITLTDPDRTDQVAVIVGSLRGRGPARLAERMRSSVTGRDLLLARPNLGDVLSDESELSRCPPGSLGRAYLAFCAERGLSAAELVAVTARGFDFEAIAALPADERFVHEWLRDSHDLFHIVLGYDTDLIGELAVLAFTLAQVRDLGVATLVAAGLLKLRARNLLPQRLAAHAIARGLRAAWFVDQPWPSLLRVPLTRVREQLRVGKPPTYHRCASPTKPAPPP